MRHLQASSSLKFGLQLIVVAAILTALLCKAQATVLRLGDRQFDPLADSPEKSLIFATGTPAGQTGGAPLKRTQMKYQTTQVQSGTQEAAEGYYTEGYYIVQFDSPIRPEWRHALENVGAVVMDYLPDFAFIVRMPPAAISSAAGLDHVRWVGEYEADWRISRRAAALSRFVTTADEPLVANGKVGLLMDAFPGESAGRITEEIMGLGGSVQEVSESVWGIRIRATLDREKIQDAADIHGIKWVELLKPRQTSNENAAAITDVRPVHTRADGLYGEGQIVAVCDSGLDRGSITEIHPDFLDGYGNSRVLELFPWGDDSFSSDLSGHGTHVAGSVLGNGISSGANPAANLFPDTCHAGMAPKALLVLQAMSDKGNSTLPGIPADLKLLFQQALDAGASIHTNSWGTSGAGNYSGESADVDQFCWSHKDFLILFAAGNAGYDKDLDGVVDLYSMDTPATAKNCLSVGVSESLRAVGGFSEKGYGEFRTYADPVASDLMSDNAKGLAAFSGRGPCLDGRTKPDLVAPGTNILSTRSAVQEGDGWGSYDPWYYYSGGSSMATPITAGAAALLREYLTSHVDQFRKTPPSSALLKACLVNAAVDIAPGQYGDGEFTEIRHTPGPAAGWGRLSLDRAVAPESPFFNTYVDNAQGLNTGEEASYTVSGEGSDSPLRITLAWTDYPAAAAADGGLVNDLDLMVTNRNGQVFYPDNARAQTDMSKVLYVTTVNTTLYRPKVAIRLTPDDSTKRLGSLLWAGNNPGNTLGDVQVEVYAADADGRPTGAALFSTTMQAWPSGEFALPVDIEVTGEIVAVFTFAKPELMGIWAQEGADSQGRCLVDQGNGWEPAGSLPAVGAFFFKANPSENFDRVNNLVGVTIDTPSGDYTVTVKGYNVPRGPQPFALVISGTKRLISPFDRNGGDRTRITRQPK